MRSSFRLAGVVVALTGAVAAFACGDDHQFNGASTSSDAGAAGAEMSSSSSGNGGSSGTVSMNEAGESAGTSTNTPGGATSSGGGSDDGAAGAGDGASLPDCAAGFSDWLTSSFAFPDGDVIGAADFPSMPWVKQGSLTIDTGRLVGTGLAVISQGSTYSYAGSRLRFRARFTDSNQEITAAFNTAKDGSGGLRVEVDGYGRLSVTEGKTTVAFVDVAPLETGVDWFVESFFEETSAVVILSRSNYASAKQSEVVARLDTDALKGVASGTSAAIELSANGTSPSIDEIALARCGKPAPKYEAKLIDGFERPDSAALGKAEFPSSSAWSTPADSGIKIVSGALQTAGNLAVAAIPLQVPLAGLRIRTTLTKVVKATEPSGFWADVNVNVTKTSNGLPAQGFWVWGDGTAFYTGLFTGGGELKHSGNILSGTYYVEMDRDGDAAVVTVRTQSFDGPILGAQYAGSLSANAEPGGYFSLGDEGGAGMRFEDVRVDNYPSP